MGHDYYLPFITRCFMIIAKLVLTHRILYRINIKIKISKENVEVFLC